MVWKEPSNDATDGFFWSTDATGSNRNNRSSPAYPDLKSARRPVHHCNEIAIPFFEDLPAIKDKHCPIL